MESLPDSPESARPAIAFEPATFREVVDRVTRVLESQLALPAFEDWVQAYRAAPGEYDEEMLGFWQWPTAGEREREAEN